MTESAIQPRLMSVDDAAKYLCICRKSLYNLTEAGKLPPIRIGRAVRYDLADLEAFILRCKGQAEGGQG